MSQQDQWQTYPSYAKIPGNEYCSQMGADDSSTFVNPFHEGSSRSFSSYAFSPETAVPPPPPDLYSPLESQPKRNKGYPVALVVLTVLIVALGSLGVMQVVAHTPLTM
jgi:hypothetical protein